MPSLGSILEILKLLDKSNCRECGETTCMAFAAAVFQGRKPLGDCTRLEAGVAEQYGRSVEGQKSMDDDMREAVNQLTKRAAEIDLKASAERLKGEYKNNRLTIKIMGKNVHVDEEINISSDIHMHAWIKAAVLNYLLECKGLPDSGKWIPLRELEGGKDWHRLFEQRCHKPLKKVADEYTDLLEDMIHIFNGERTENHYQSDISLVLRPLPRFPILICYWRPDDCMESDLNIFFDANAEENLRIESIFSLSVGLSTMFQKIAQTHGQ